MQTIDWLQKDLYGSEYLFGHNKETIGHLHFPSPFKQEATCRLEDQAFSFIPEGLFSNHIHIVSQGQEVGTIKQSPWGGAYEIYLQEGETYAFHSEGWHRNRHCLTKANEAIISYEEPVFSMEGRGSIHLMAEGGEQLLLLAGTGLYLKSISQKNTAAMVAVFIPVFALLFLH